MSDLARKTIIKEINKNIFVLAGAGSGKTTMLVNRMVAMVESGIPISEICAITFTVNAAARFLSDFQKVLRKRSIAPDDYKPANSSDLGSSCEEKRNCCKEALKNIDLCFAGTIDSFCQKIISEIPYDANLPSSTSIIAEDEEHMIYQEFFKEISLNPGELSFEYNNFAKLHQNPADFFSKAISEVMSVSTLNIVHDDNLVDIDLRIKKLEEKYAKVLGEDIRILLKMENDVTEGYIDSYHKFASGIMSTLKGWTPANFIKKFSTMKNLLSDIAFNEMPEMESIPFKFTKKRLNNPARYNFDSKNEEGIFTEFKNEVNEIKYDYSMAFLVKASDYIHKRLRDLGKLTFDEYLLTLRDVLINDMKHGAKLINHISKKYRYFLLDESQDTSPYQTEIFLYLTSMRKATTKHECKPRPGSLFIVGDPKQSIYRFKNADIISYNDTKSMFNDNDNIVLELINNFRSTKTIKKYFNKSFERLPDYIPIPVDDKPDIPNTGLYKVDTNNGNYLDVIKTMVNNKKYYLKYDKEKDKGMPTFEVTNSKGEKETVRYISYKDFMLITKATTDHLKIMEALYNEGIPYYVEGKYYIKDNDLVKTIYAIYYYLSVTDIYKSGAYYNLLTSPLFNLSVKDAISSKVKMDDDIKDKLNKIDSLKNISDPIILYDKILNDLNLIDEIGYKNLDLSYFILEKIKNEVISNNISTIKEACEFLDKFLQTKLDRYLNLNSNPNAVYLANLHKVKGLEKPIVILISSKPKTKVSKTADYINNKAYIFKIEDENYMPFLSTKRFKDIEEEEKHQAELEEERLIYVAATRARNYLIIEECKYWAPLINEMLTPFEFEESHLPDKVYAKGPLAIDINPYFDNKEIYTDMTPSKLERVHNKIDEDKPEDNDYNNIHYDAKLTGTIIHRLMELIVKSNDLYSLSDLINIINNEYDIPDGLSNLIESVYTTMHSGGYQQKNGKDSDLLKILKNKETYQEIPFTYEKNNKVYEGIIDLLYNDNGKWYIVDYKTNYDDNNLDITYKEQLNAYKEALKEIKGIDAEAYIYHINK